LNIPLLRFASPLWFILETPVLNLSIENSLSWGFLSLQRIWTARIHVLPFDGKAPLTRPKSLARVSPAGPTLPATVPLSGFLNLSAILLLSLPPYRFQAGNTHGIAPFRDFLLLRSLQQLVAVRLPS
jgi:hypothetical protein